MCNRYEISTPYEQISERYNAHQVGQLNCSGEVLPRGMAPGLLLNLDRERELHAMQFSFAPPGCTTPSDPKRPLNNARIESVAKWPWKEAFQSTRCVLPLTAFREPSYWGETEGTEVYFQRKDGDLLHVAGLYRLWRSPMGDNEVYTMSFLMRPASDYVMEHGHHRQPLFIDEQGIDDWLSPEKLTTKKALDTLRTYAATPELVHRHVRNMAASWKSRQKTKLKSRHEQLDFLDRCEHACGF